MSGLDFCCGCGEWIGAVKYGDKVSGGGTIRKGPDGQPEIICKACEAIEQSRAVPITPGSRSGTLGDSKVKTKGNRTA
jgi:hypothetical protein